MKKILAVSVILVFAMVCIFISVKATSAVSNPLVFKSCKVIEKRESHPKFMASKSAPSRPMMAAPEGAPPMAKEMKASGDKGTDVHKAGKKAPKDVQKASEVYLSNDDSMSLSSAQRIFWAIDNFMPVYRNEVRPHELLNYYHFKTLPVGGKLFSVLPELAENEKGSTISFAVQGKSLSVKDRPNAVITLIVDRSGSMTDQGKMDYLKAGLAEMKSQLKNGDVISLIEFDHENCTALESYTIGRDAPRYFDTTVKELVPRGSTNMHQGLVEGYKLAEKYYDPSKMNRVILITDAMANRGELSPELMASIGKYYDTKKIALSGIGVGKDFNDELLNELTEKGRGAYLFLGMKDAIKRVFGTEFISLLDTIARDVHFKVILPKGLKIEQFYGEEASADKSKVQPINYFANTSQLFLMDLNGKPDSGGLLGLEITYKTPDSDKEEKDANTFGTDELRTKTHDNINKARILMAFANMLEKTAITGAPVHFWAPPSKDDLAKMKSPESKKLCDEGLKEMKKLSESYSDDETKSVMNLGEKYCSRF